MKKLESSLKNMLLALTCITMVMVGILAVVNELTRDTIAATQAKALSNAISAVVPGFDNDPIAEKRVENVDGVEYTVYPATKGGEFLGAAVESSALGFGGQLSIIVGFDAQGCINDYSLLSHSETPGLGAKADVWFKKGAKGDITGKSPKDGELTVTKDGGQIDAITASTITSRAFLKAVNNAYKVYSGNAADATTGATSQTVAQTK